MHIAMGRNWFGHKVTRGGVVYVAAEAGASMRRRVVAFRKHPDGSVTVTCDGRSVTVHPQALPA